MYTLISQTTGPKVFINREINDGISRCRDIESIIIYDKEIFSETRKKGSYDMHWFIIFMNWKGWSFLKGSDRQCMVVELRMYY